MMFLEHEIATISLSYMEKKRAFILKRQDRRRRTLQLLFFTPEKQHID